MYPTPITPSLLKNDGSKFPTPITPSLLKNDGSKFPESRNPKQCNIIQDRAVAGSAPASGCVEIERRLHDSAGSSPSSSRHSTPRHMVGFRNSLFGILSSAPEKKGFPGGGNRKVDLSKPLSPEPCILYAGTKFQKAEAKGQWMKIWSASSSGWVQIEKSTVISTATRGRYT
uniref:Uncharacterized protein n=1 Tax=Oryza rufipogon TaxID=4529 RepID=A0A0E0PSB8_ORYRU